MSSELPPENTDKNLRKATPLHRLPKPITTSLQEIITSHINPDGTTGLPVRELTKALQVAAETLQVARFQPENLSLASLFSLAERMGLTPGEVVATVSHQVRQQRQAAQPPVAAKTRRQRSRPATPEADGEPAPEPAPQTPTPPDLDLANQAEPAPPNPSDSVPEPHPQAQAEEFAEDLAQKVAYADATPTQRAHALASVQQELSHYFPIVLSPAAWDKALDAVQPDLWVEAVGEPHITFEQPELQQLLQHLDRSKDLPLCEMTIYSPTALFMARRLAYHSCLAVEALAEIERNPAAFGSCTQNLIFLLANGHSDEDKVLAAFGEDIATLNTNGPPRPQEQLPGSPSVLARIFRLNWPNGVPGGFRRPLWPPLGPQAGPPGMA